MQVQTSIWRSFCESWVSDLGTEAGFASVSKVPLSTLFPFLESSPHPELQAAPQDEVDFADVLQCEGEVDFSNPPGPGDSQQYIDTEGSIMVPGVLHILHNCFRSLCDNLELGDKLQSVCDMVGRPEHGALAQHLLSG